MKSSSNGNGSLSVSHINKNSSDVLGKLGSKNNMREKNSFLQNGIRFSWCISIPPLFTLIFYSCPKPNWFLGSSSNKPTHGTNIKTVPVKPGCVVIISELELTHCIATDYEKLAKINDKNSLQRIYSACKKQCAYNFKSRTDYTATLNRFCDPYKLSLIKD